MKIKYLLGVACLLACSQISYAQYVTDALRYSQTDNTTSARFKALGGAQTAVGGDISSLSGNPAGLGLFTRSEISFTPYYGSYGNDGTYLGETRNGNKSQLGISQFGGVFYSPTVKQKGSNTSEGILSFNFGIGYNKTNDFNNKIVFGGTNNKSSIADFFADQANQLSSPPPTPDQLKAGYNNYSGGYDLPYTAFENYLINYNGTNGAWAPATALGNKQANTETRTGYQSEFNVGFGSNYSNKLYFGATLSFTSLKLNSDRVFNESGSLGSDLYNMDFTESTQTKGNGFNAKLGLIYKINSVVRIGASYNTPTWYNIQDSYFQNLVNYKNAYNVQIDPYNSEFNLRTPGKITAGIALFANNLGFLTFDADYINYKDIKLSSDAVNDASVIAANNKDIQDLYRDAFNIRVGAEGRLNDNFSLRAGYSQVGNPYEDKSNDAYQKKSISGGLGYRKDNFYADATYVNSKYNSYYKAYDLVGLAAPTASVKNITNAVYLTLGVRF
ncbi:OmpP1/FadL family transporter [Pedobacter nototheniae]|uniref:OmpP1/FadL family transporter n=1 Tax=Pedobacter nototheniae TaxID=2488994 RepID=UPI00103BC55A|nr:MULTISPECIES: outer membrane protein transport protein [Pedobacter]